MRVRSSIYTPQHGLTDPISLTTQGTKYWLISIKYWLPNGWGSVSTQAGQLNTKPHPALWWQQSKGTLMMMSAQCDTIMTTSVHNNKTETKWNMRWLWNKMETRWPPATTTNQVQLKQQLKSKARRIKFVLFKTNILFRKPYFLTNIHVHFFFGSAISDCVWTQPHTHPHKNSVPYLQFRRVFHTN